MFETINDSPNLVTAVTDEMLGPLLIETPTVNRMIYGSLREAPKIGVVGNLGYGATSYLKEVPLLGPTAVRVVNVP